MTGNQNKFVKVAVLDSEVQARLLDSRLEEEDIPHILRSYQEAAFDGVFALHKGWGHIEAPEQYKQRVLEIINETQP
jgi:hypothetical protein